jgi:oligopeptide/dipeptide ABC transporter ATP-binding protein
MEKLLEITDLVVGFETPKGFVKAVDGVSFSISQGETVGLVGESGCGKSTVAFSILRLLPHPVGKIASGSICFEGRELTTLPQKALCEIRGRDIAMIFQEPMSALNPVMRIGDQIAEPIIIHEGPSAKKSAAARAVELLAKVGIPDPAGCARAYPHQLSGGMRQRVVIAMALACRPKLIIADEPTTALDVTLQKQILELLASLQREMGLAILFITHDLGLVKKLCAKTLVMYAGQIVEAGPTSELFAAPRHPYTTALLAARPSDAMAPKTLLKSIPGRLPSYWEWASGCRFRARCTLATVGCEAPQALIGSPERCVRCCQTKEAK